MSLIVEFRNHTDEFLPDSLTTLDGFSRAQLERVFPREGRTILYLWVPAEHVTPPEGAVQWEGGDDGLYPICRDESRTLVRTAETSLRGSTLEYILQSESLLHTAAMDSDTWTAVCEFDNHDQLAAWYQATTTTQHITINIDTISPKSEYSSVTDDGEVARSIVDDDMFERALGDLLHAAFVHDVSPSGLWTVDATSKAPVSAWEVVVDPVVRTDE